MRRQSAIVVAALAAPAALAGCGGGSTSPTTSAAATPTTTAPRTVATAPPFRIALTAPTHRPRANVKWPITVRVVNAAGRPVAAKLKMRILYGGTPVGVVDNGRVYRFVGTWRERPGNEITFPKEAVGQPLVFQVVVTALGRTRTANYAITVRK